MQKLLKLVSLFSIVSFMFFGSTNAHAEDYRKHSIMFNPLGSFFLAGNMLEYEYSANGALGGAISYSSISIFGGTGSSVDLMFRWHWRGNGVEGGYLGVGVNRLGARFSNDYIIYNYKETITTNLDSTGFKGEIGYRSVRSSGWNSSYFLQLRQSNINMTISNSRGQTASLFESGSYLATGGVIPIFGFAVGYSF